jgi:hypothetical protein
MTGGFLRCETVPGGLDVIDRVYQELAQGIFEQGGSMNPRLLERGPRERAF